MSEILEAAASSESDNEVRPYTGSFFANLALAGLGLTALLDVLQIGVSMMAHSSLNNDAHFDAFDGWNPPEWLFAFDSILVVGPGLALLCTAVAFLTWFSRAYSYASQKANLARYPILSWFIPLANLWMPYGCVRDVWSAITGKPTGVVQLWWGCWVARALVSNATRAEAATVEELANLHVAMIAASLVDLIAAMLAARIVLQIDSAARSKSPTTF